MGAVQHAKTKTHTLICCLKGPYVEYVWLSRLKMLSVDQTLALKMRFQPKHFTYVEVSTLGVFLSVYRLNTELQVSNWHRNTSERQQISFVLLSQWCLYSP